MPVPIHLLPKPYDIETVGVRYTRIQYKELPNTRISGKGCIPERHKEYRVVYHGPSPIGEVCQFNSGYNKKVNEL